ncbi:MAG: hypothetical protein Q8Q49_00380 [bacterium]|nr:hypothetical protein [bacterium]
MHQDYIKVMEIINFKLQKFWTDYQGNFEDFLPPEITITEEDLRVVKIDKYACLTCLEHLKQKGYLYIDRVHDSEDVLNMDHDQIEETTPAIYCLSIAKEILPLIRWYKQGKTEDVPRGVSFDCKKSILNIGDKSVHIQQKNDKPNSHYILEYIFENPDGLEAKSYYSEILDAKFHDEHLTQRSMWRACEAINLKVSKQAGLGNFLLSTSGKTGYVQINPEYLETTIS